jgi:hypothetical protein
MGADNLWQPRGPLEGSAAAAGLEMENNLTTVMWTPISFRKGFRSPLRAAIDQRRFRNVAAGRIG